MWQDEVPASFKVLYWGSWGDTAGNKNIDSEDSRYTKRGLNQTPQKGKSEAIPFQPNFPSVYYAQELRYLIKTIGVDQAPKRTEF
jgi:hypothetical protein